MSARKFCYIFLFLFFQIQAFAQLGSVRVSIYGGGSVQFVFNTIAEYKAGVTYTNYTVLGIGVTEPAANFNGWTLKVSAEDADGDLQLTGSVPANVIPFADMQVQASVKACAPAPCPVNVFGSPWVNLVPFASGPTTIADGSSDGNCPCPPGILTTVVPATTQLNISYRCGVLPAGSMLGLVADVYSDNLFFDIAFF